LLFFGKSKRKVGEAVEKIGKEIGDVTGLEKGKIGMRRPGSPFLPVGIKTAKKQRRNLPSHRSQKKRLPGGQEVNI
jgi:hypothetical protein